MPGPGEPAPRRRGRLLGARLAGDQGLGASGAGSGKPRGAGAGCTETNSACPSLNFGHGNWGRKVQGGEEIP